MLDGGEYYIPFYDIDEVLSIFAFVNKLDKDLVYEVYEAFKENNFIQFLDTTSILGFSIITNSYVVLNYELTNTNKKKERDIKREKRKKEKEEKKNNIPSSPLLEDEEISEDDFSEPEGFTW